MGRYDNVRVFYNNAWHRPTRMYVFNGNPIMSNMR